MNATGGRSLLAVPEHRISRARRIILATKTGLCLFHDTGRQTFGWMSAGGLISAIFPAAALSCTLAAGLMAAAKR